MVGNDRYAVEVGRRIRVRRKELKMSQEELAHLIGLETKQAVSKIELGQRNIRQQLVVRLAKVLDVDPLYILAVDYDEADD